MSDEYVSKSGLTYYHNKLKAIFQTKMVVLSYGSSTWSDFIAAYNDNAVVYCKASSNSNPGTGSQTRRAFMAYLNNNDTPTNVEFQYYRSVSSHSATQQGDQVFVYKLDKTSGWSVTTREASVNIAAGSGLSRSYSSDVVTLEVTGKQDTLVSGTNIKTINSNSILGSGDLSIPVPTKTSDLTNDSGFIAEDSNGDISITRNIWADGDVKDGAGNLLSDKLGMTDILDIFYPVGSYYETSDTTFDPNTSWGGTWVLETGGQVHVSSGTEMASGTAYIVYGANRGSQSQGVSDGGSRIPALLQHTHSAGTLEGSTPTLTASDNTFMYSTSAITKYDGKFSSSGGDYQYIRQKVSDSGTIGRKAPSISSGKKVKISGDTGETGTQSTGGNMQPYIVINRWHRSA